MIQELRKLISSARLPVQDEKELQDAIEQILKKHGVLYKREHILDVKNRIDFYFDSGNIGMEIKIKGTVKNIYRQCERYCKLDTISQFILVTNRTMGFPTEINGKPCYIIKLGMAWL